MARGRKRTPEEYKREIEDAAKRIKKHPEYLKPSRDNRQFIEFLRNLPDFNTNSLATDSGLDFWENVRDEITRQDTGGFTTRGMAEQLIDVISYERASPKGKVYTQQTIRSRETGRFVKRSSIEIR